MVLTDEYDNITAIKTINMHPHLFKITTPIKVDHFEELLSEHLNGPAVESVYFSLHHSFWLHAHMRHKDYPTTWDDLHYPIKSQDERDLEGQMDKEVTAGQYSEDLGPDLLLGMYCLPIHTIPKPGMNSLHLINDKSDGEFSLNSMINHDDIAGTCMDGIKSLGASLHAFCREHGNHLQLVIYMSDIQGAYCNIPMAPLWQLKQTLTFDKQQHVDRCSCFDCQGSYYTYLAFISIVCWIMLYVKRILHLKFHIDDNCSFALLRDVKYYPKYKCYFSTDQAKLLETWDELGLPHKEKKQIYGPVIPLLVTKLTPML